MLGRVSEAEHRKLRGLIWSKRKRIALLAFISGHFEMATFREISRLFFRRISRRQLTELQAMTIGLKLLFFDYH